MQQIHRHPSSAEYKSTLCRNIRGIKLPLHKMEKGTEVNLKNQNMQKEATEIEVRARLRGPYLQLRTL